MSFLAPQPRPTPPTGSILDMSQKQPPKPRDARRAEALKRNIARRKAAAKQPKPKG